MDFLGLHTIELVLYNMHIGHFFFFLIHPQISPILLRYLGLNVGIQNAVRKLWGALHCTWSIQLQQHCILHVILAFGSGIAATTHSAWWPAACQAFSTQSSDRHPGEGACLSHQSLLENGHLPLYSPWCPSVSSFTTPASPAFSSQPCWTAAPCSLTPVILWLLTNSETLRRTTLFRTGF